MTGTYKHFSLMKKMEGVGDWGHAPHIFAYLCVVGHVGNKLSLNPQEGQRNSALLPALDPNMKEKKNL